MTLVVPRTCTEVPHDTAGPGRTTLPPRSLDTFRDAAGYVLLGDAGAGKTTAFRRECNAGEDNALYLSARDFLTLDPERHPEWAGRTLFIDGLDEVRAGAADARTPFDSIRGRLDALGQPRFRLSCRQADWLGTNDRNHLDTVTRGGKVLVLKLDPLTASDVRVILQEDERVDDAGAFIQEAKQRRIDGLLFNPQGLALLVEAVAHHGWPDGRLQTFETACSQLATESNDDHAAASSSVPPQRLLAAAGSLCAHALVAGTAGYTLHSSDVTSDAPAVDRCIPDDFEAARAAVASKLFTRDTRDRFVPLHRHVAEFLAGRYLAERVAQGLPVRRVLALMTGSDGSVVTQLRGLSAWLAAHCARARAELIERDPTGVALYGDLGRFSTQEKRSLLESLARITSRDLPWSSIASFAPLISPELEATLEEILDDPDQDPAHQHLVQFVLRIVPEAVSLPGLAPSLLRVARDDARQSGVNVSALDAFIHCYQGPDKPALLRGLTDEVTMRREWDPDRDMLGTLLSNLYPKPLSPREVWDYLIEPDEHERAYVGSYAHFWEHRLFTQSSDAEICELLDQCVPRARRIRSALAARLMERVLPDLLAQGLQAAGDSVDSGRLYDWLGLAAPSDDGLSFRAKSSDTIRAWLTTRPDVQKSMFLEGLRRCPDSEEFPRHALRISDRWYGAHPPPDLGPWLLDQALAWSRGSRRKAQFLLWSAVDMGRLDVSDARPRVAGDPFLTEVLERGETARREVQELREERTHYDEERRRRQEEWIDAIRSHESSLSSNEAPPRLLHEIARRFFGSFVDFRADQGRERIAGDLGHDLPLTQTVLAALRNTPGRDDLPSFEEILRLHGERRMHYLGLPYLAGLALRETLDPPDVSGWAPDDRRRATALYMTFPHGNYEPEWYRHLVAHRPRDVAQVQVHLAEPALRQGRDAHYNLWHLAHDPSHAAVARLACLPLLLAFPIRATLRQLPTLDLLLKAAICHSAPTGVQDTLAKKLSHKSMNTLQRAHWLAAGCVTAPETYRERAAAFAAGGRREERVRHLLAPLCSDDGTLVSIDDLDVATLRVLVRLGGATVGPEDWGQGGIVRSSMRICGLVGQLIQYLARDPSPTAGEALRALSTEPDLARWHEILASAADDQKVIGRDHSYRHPSFEEVLQTLSGGAPANPADLAALTADLLRELTDYMLQNSNPWRPYWNEDSHRRPTEPKPEDSCRDALVDWLRGRVPEGIDVQPETRYAHETRADIRLAYNGFHVPVEIKKNAHRDLWSAMRTQLIEQYTIDPATDGYGIYAVLWFGPDRTQLPPSGRRPGDPAELGERLTDVLPDGARRKVCVRVIDVSGRQRVSSPTSGRRTD
ncbi:MAG: hypothetical protein OXM56_04515 [Gammaproteobacteria bacterium]|nr:hypothetical protein [Gammaproteobacteria bacterium]